MTRTDIHRPSVIKPEEYDFVAFECVKIVDFGDCAEVLRNRAIIAEHMARTGGLYSGHEHGGNCHVCGADCIYTVLFWHRETNRYIRTGGDCAEKMSMSYGDMNAFQSTVRHAIGRAKGKKAAIVKWTDAGLARALELRESYRALPAIAGLGLQPEDFVSHERERQARAEVRERYVRWQHVEKLMEMIKTTEQYGTLSQPMIDFARKLVERFDAPRVVEEDKPRGDCPKGRVTVTGKILKVTVRETGYGQVTKMLFEANEGFKLWVTLPSGAPEDRGQVITFKATVTPSPDDPKFGFAARPRLVA